MKSSVAHLSPRRVDLKAAFSSDVLVRGMAELPEGLDRELVNGYMERFRVDLERKFPGDLNSQVLALVAKKQKFLDGTVNSEFNNRECFYALGLLIQSLNVMVAACGVMSTNG